MFLKKKLVDPRYTRASGVRDFISYLEIFFMRLGSQDSLHSFFHTNTFVAQLRFLNDLTYLLFSRPRWLGESIRQTNVDTQTNFGFLQWWEILFSLIPALFIFAIDIFNCLVDATRQHPGSLLVETWNYFWTQTKRSRIAVNLNKKVFTNYCEREERNREQLWTRIKVTKNYCEREPRKESKNYCQHKPRRGSQNNCKPRTKRTKAIMSSKALCEEYQSEGWNMDVLGHFGLSW